MKFLIVLLRVFTKCFKINLLKTVYFNFKVLPFKQALKLPIHFYGRTQLDNITGTIIIDTPSVKFGMISFGGKHEIAISSNKPTRIYNKGKVIFKGDGKFGMGNNIVVWDNGVLNLGNDFSIGSETRIVCFRNISLGDSILVSWECQFFDSDFHFIKLSGNLIKDNCGELIIGNNVWIGSRVTILKDTYISNNTIVGSSSLCSGNYKAKYGDSILLAGVPAKYLKKDVVYIKDKKQEEYLRKYFIDNKKQNLIWNS